MKGQATQGSLPNPPSEGVSLYGLTLGLAVALSVGFCLQLPAPAITALGGSVLSAGMALTLRDPASALALVPLITHIGPILRGPVAGLGMVSLGDGYLAVVFGLCGVRWLRTRPALGWPRRTLLILALLFAVSLPRCPDLAACMLGWVSILQVVLYYVCVRIEINTTTQGRRLLAGVGLAAIVGAALHIYWYTQGVSLLMTEEQWSLDSAGPFARLSEVSPVFQKTSFFHGSFIGTCAATMAIGLLAAQGGTRKTALFWLVAVASGLASSLVSGNRTPIVSAVIGALVVLLFGSAANARVRPRLGRVLGAAAGVVLGSAALAVVVPVQQLDLYREMVIGDAATSVGERVVMWQAAAQKLLHDPLFLVAGLGPEVAVRVPDVPAISEVMYIPELSFQVMSFHNFYVDLVFQQGACFAVVFVWLMVSTFVLLMKSLRKVGGGLTGPCAGGLLAWLVMWNSHATGWSKPTLVFAALLGLAHAIISGELTKGEG